MKITILYVLLLISLMILMYSCDIIIATESDIEEACEYAYFEGQRDALEGDVRIKRNSENCWMWIDSPWDSGKPPIFDPSFNCK